MQTIGYGELGPVKPYHAVVVDSPGFRSTRHDREGFVEIMYVLAGSGRHYFADQRDPLTPGLLYLLLPGIPHAIESSGREPVRFVNIALPSATWESLLDAAGVAAAMRHPAGWARRRVPPDQAGAVEGECLRLAQAYERTPSGVDLLRFAATIFPLLASNRLAATVPDWLTAACAEFDRRRDCWNQGVGLLVELSSVSHEHLDRSMRRFFGVTPSQWVEQRRMRRARLLLLTSDLAIASIAVECGFGNISYFSRRFSGTHAMSPREYRNRNRPLLGDPGIFTA
ncbi:AraC family transcriptional regulator [Allokutzneria sp. A3M-2-11 16]|uniref:helix-turn-helix transcriptional regulator n=1 Tax=Allokutzneria sp. A3M-2-11 16 TaxID=2962043 RepID=UPI0020B6BD10|nr:AraC family transcriptional regulator [Allokutzneria sp. A3M-2-11 16]MCP3805293.1 AraC family transcriptional regulator [Allokutzneria sp. A3M-2-11 16]